MDIYIQAAKEIIRDDPNGLKVFSVTGSQGTGKTTVFNEFRKLVESGDNSEIGKVIKDFGEIYFVERKTSRSIQEEMGITKPEELFTDRELIKKFQTKALARKAFDDIIKPYETGYKIVVTERSPFDLASYTTAHLGFYSKYDSFVNRYINEATKLSDVYFSMILKGGLFDIEHDGIRPVNSYYQSMIEKLQLQLLNERNSNYWDICDSPRLSERINMFAKLMIDVSGVKFND